jgi:MraZ protein
MPFQGMFRGTTKVTIDDKGRVVVPSQHRAELIAPAEGRVIVTVHQDKCLLVYTLPEWDRVEAQLMAAPTLNNPRALAVQELLTGRAQELVVDSHGRLSLTPELRQYARLGRAACFVGMRNRLALWDEQRWNAHIEQSIQTEQTATTPAEGLAGLSL